jgi:hypothetical protein
MIGGFSTSLRGSEKPRSSIDVMHADVRISDCFAVSTEDVCGKIEI